MNILRLSDLQKLIKSNKAIKLKSNSPFYVSVIDILYEYEKVKKNIRALKIWGNIRKQSTGLNMAINNGDVITLNLDKGTLEEALFTNVLEGEVELWDKPSTTTIPPEQSVRLVIFKYFDEYHDTELHKTCISEYES